MKPEQAARQESLGDTGDAPASQLAVRGFRRRLLKGPGAESVPRCFGEAGGEELTGHRLEQENRQLMAWNEDVRRETL